MITRQQHLDAGLGMADHRRYFAQFVTEATRQRIRTIFGPKALRAATQCDAHLNSIPIKRWDAVSWRSLDGNRANAISGRFVAAIDFDRAAAAGAGETITRATLVCIAKEAARQVAERARHTPVPVAAVDYAGCIAA